MIALPKALPAIMAACLLAASMPSRGQATATSGIVGLFAEARLDAAMEQCSELAFSDDASALERARAVAMLALTYHLQDLPDAADRIGQLREVCADDARLDRPVLLPVLAYLAGEHSAEAMTTALDKATPDWQAFGILCRYVMAARANPDPRALHSLYRDYADATVILRGDWAAAWADRITEWQRSLQDRQAISPMEPFVAARLAERAGQAEASDRSQAANEAAFAAVDAIAKAYLDNRPADAQGLARKASQALDALPAPEAEAFRKVFAYLAGDRGITSRDIFQRAQANPRLWSLACVAMFARDVAATKDTAALDQVMLLNHLDNFHANLGQSRDAPSIAAWEAQTRAWEAWCTGNFAARPDLPPLLASRSGKGAAPANANASPSPQATSAALPPAGNFPPIAEVTPEGFAEGRDERYKARPRPADLTFDDAQLKRYLASLPPELQEVERKRAEIVAKVKPHLVHIFARSPYRGDIRLRTRTRRGIISMANENILVFKSTEKGKPQRIKWSDLAIEQYVAFLEHFARQRLGASAAGQISPEERKLNAANDYLAMALVCDWYEQYDKALRLAQRAAETAPAIEASAARLILP